LRILILINWYPPEIRSASHLFGELAEGLSARGHQVTVVTRWPDERTPGWTPRPRRSVERGVTVIRVARREGPRTWRLVRMLEQFVHPAALFAGALRWAGPADVVLAYSPPLPLGLAVGGLARRWGGKGILNVQDLYPQGAIDLGLLRNPLAIRLARQLERACYESVDALVVHSEGNREYVVGTGVPLEKVSVIPNWADLAALAPGERLNAFRRSLGLADDIFLVSYAGVIGFAQDLDTVVRAAERLRDEHRIHFLLVGDGSLKPALERHVAAARLRNVTLMGLQPVEVYGDILRASDACLVTLRPDVRTPVVPAKLVSIMAVGRPVVATSHPGGDVPRIVAEAECGVHVAGGDAGGLAAAILRMSRQPALAAACGRNGRAYAEKHFSRETGVTAYEQLMRALAG
jgi:glycosyltransferase involved in cell wall biosynthesis